MPRRKKAAITLEEAEEEIVPKNQSEKQILLFHFNSFIKRGNLGIDFHLYDKEKDRFYAWRDVKQLIMSSEITLHDLHSIEFSLKKAITELMSAARSAAKRSSGFNSSLFQSLLSLHKRDLTSGDEKSFYSEIGKLIHLMQHDDSKEENPQEDEINQLKQEILAKLGETI